MIYNRRASQCFPDIPSPGTLIYWYLFSSISRSHPRPQQQSSSPVHVPASQLLHDVAPIPASTENLNSRIQEVVLPDAKFVDGDQLDRYDCTWAGHLLHTVHVTHKTNIKMGQKVVGPWSILDRGPRSDFYELLCRGQLR